ncbi:MAG: hypothetical protein IKV43_05640 [Clostridia bacterium]|nr:hypothetical protein [Clostridia bacterium]
MFGIAKVSDLLDWRAVMLLWGGVALVGAVFSLVALKRYTKFISNGENNE